jgi:hypothetical protein
MKFKGSIEIDKPQEVVSSFFINPDYLGEYQEGFLRKELVSGNAGEKGAISKMYYAMGKREMELTETVIANNLPNVFEGHYHHKHMDNTMKCTFTALEPNKTLYESEIEYTRINWVMPRLMAILFPGMYKKPAQRWLNNFKAFVEKQP